ncbi:hypothetical protein [Kangiella sp. TOML190]|uniref:hypothetical protein n=1 Tax=Kangiella sp. TOML190 TaxID=2931351 RepID=UPI002040AC4F|nr:hypothetical protein [Kangiella sp. TOML190]
MNDKLLLSVLAAWLMCLSGCSNEPKESDKLLSDYKKQQMQKAKEVEDLVNKRTENLDQQLKELQEQNKKKKDEPQ